MSIELKDHQNDIISFASTRPGSIVAAGTGCGKSVMKLVTSAKLLYENKIDKAFICGTKASLPEIRNDANKFFGNSLSLVSNTYELEDFIESDKNIAVLRYEYFKNIDLNTFKRSLHNNRNSFFLDEAQKVKSSSTKAHQYVKEIRGQIDYFSEFTATPLMTSLDDLYNLMYLVDPRVLSDEKTFQDNYYVTELAPSYTPKYNNCPTHKTPLYFHGHTFRCLYCDYKKYIKLKYSVVEYKNLDLLSDILKDYLISYYPVHNINYLIEKATLDDYTEYDNVAKDIDNGGETQHSVRLIELQYVVNRSRAKINLFKRTLNKVLDKGSIVYCSFHKSIEIVTDILKEANIDYRVISGVQSDQERQEAKEWFTSDARNKILIISAAGGASLNLQATPNFIFYDIPWNAGAFLQAIGRVVRLFSAFKEFFIYFIIVEETVDDYKFECCFKLKDAFSTILQTMKFPKGIMASFNSHVLTKIRQKYAWRR